MGFLVAADVRRRIVRRQFTVRLLTSAATGRSFSRTQKLFSTRAAEQLVNLLLYNRVHLNQRRPRAFETFAGKFFGGVDPQFAADGKFARRVVERVGGA